MKKYNYQECHEEPIHTPGHIQSFGYLVVLDYESRVIKFVSENIHEIFDINAVDLLGNLLTEFPQIYNIIHNAETTASFRLHEQKNKIFQPEIIRLLGHRFYYQLYISDNHIFMEFEKVSENSTNRNIILNIGNDVLRVETEDELWQSLVNEINDIIDYDRVMIYKFLPDGSGKVIAENKNKRLESLLHVHYPESDIPKQARALYLQKRKRIVSDVNSPVVPVVSQDDEPLNMFMVSSRAVSPIHIEYLKNSNVNASFSTSIVVNDQLWGLVACQNFSAKHIDLYDRQMAEVLTRITANTYVALQNKKQLNFSHKFYQVTLDLKEDILLENSLEEIEDLIGYLNSFVSADGTVLYSPDHKLSAGHIPGEKQIETIAEWAVNTLKEDIFYTECLHEVSGLNFQKDPMVSGAMILMLDRITQKMVIWFKKESVRQIRWAGIQDKSFEEREIYGQGVLVKAPRKSFEIVKETLYGKSEPWQDSDIVGITILQNLILETTNQKNVRIAELNQVLKEKNEELDTFSYTVSHDLRSPLTVMGLNAQHLLSGVKDEVQKSQIKEILNQIEDLTTMMNDILNLSRVNKSEIILQSLETTDLIHRTIHEARANFSEKTEVVIGELHPIHADRTMAYQVFSNVIGNAVKYSSRTAKPKVEIYSEITDGQVVYSVSDNGIGISEDSREKMFQLFSRQPNAMDFKGSGVGLSIVKRLMSRLGGDINFESEKGNGTIFYLTFQKPKK